MCKIEMLYPEICNYFGDYDNVIYLASCIENAKVINTHLPDTPAFVNDEVDFIYMGSMTEKSQEIVIEKLKPYVKELKKLINENKVILFTGNAVEVLGNYIEKDNGEKIEALGILDFYTKRQMMNRLNCLALGDLEVLSPSRNEKESKKENTSSDSKNKKSIKIVGFKSQFTQSFGDNSKNYFVKLERGFGLDEKSKLEGFRINNLFATFILGPILPLNPEFTKYILRLLNQKDELKFEKEATEAYEIRLKEFEDKNTKG